MVKNTNNINSFSLPKVQFAEKTLDISEEIMNALKEIEPFKGDSKYYDFTNLASGELFAKCIQKSIVWIKGEGYHYFDGKKYTPDIDGLKIAEYAKTFAEQLLVYATNYTNQNNTIAEDTKQAIIKKAYSFQQKKQRSGIIDEARHYVAKEASEFDANPNIFNCQNCVIDLDSWQARPHSPSDYCRFIAGVEYDPSVSNKFFHKYLYTIMNGNRERADYLQKVLGQALGGELHTENILLAYGPATRNGKSTMFGTLSTVFGDYSVSVNPNTFYLEKRGSAGQNDDVHRMIKKRLILVGEPKKSAVLDDERIKQFTGQDKIATRTLYKSFIEETIKGKIIMPTNYIHSFDESIYKSRRLIVIPFEKSFSEEEADESIKRSLRAKEIKSSILNWLLQGYFLVKKNKWKIEMPEDIRKAIKMYKENTFQESMFVKEALIASEGAQIEFKKVHEAYTKWASYIQKKPAQFLEFKERLKELGITVEPNSKGKLWIKGYLMSEDAEEMYME